MDINYGMISSVTLSFSNDLLSSSTIIYLPTSLRVAWLVCSRFIMFIKCCFVCSEIKELKYMQTFAYNCVMSAVSFYSPYGEWYQRKSMLGIVFSSTPVLTSSIDVVFILSTRHTVFCFVYIYMSHVCMNVNIHTFIHTFSTKILLFVIWTFLFFLFYFIYYDLLILNCSDHVPAK